VTYIALASCSNFLLKSCEVSCEDARHLISSKRSISPQNVFKIVELLAFCRSRTHCLDSSQRLTNCKDTRCYLRRLHRHQLQRGYLGRHSICKTTPRFPPSPTTRKVPSKGTIAAQTYGNRCFEIGTGVAPGGPVGSNSEDCLVLNIYTPGKTEGGKRSLHPSPPWPVMFYAHGGGFNQGSGSDYMAQSMVNHSVELRSPIVVPPLSR
jgi:hypothetical protein